ncbi:enolase C-terminal domain-like protein [Escherichia coli]
MKSSTASGDGKQLIEEQLIDYIRTTLTHAGGITGCPDCRFCFAVSGTYWLTRSFRFVTSLHGCGAALYFAESQFRCPGIHGLFRTNARSLPDNWTFDNGYMHPGDKPGLGIEFDEKLAAIFL